MLSVGDSVLYGVQGICIVDSMMEREFKGEKINYYVLKPINNSNSVLYVPSNNKELVSKIKKVLNEKEFKALERNKQGVYNLPDNDMQDYKDFLTKYERMKSGDFNGITNEDIAQVLYYTDTTDLVSDGKIGSFAQGWIGDCWFLSMLGNYASTKEGEENIAKRISSPDEKGNYNLSTFLKTDSGDYERKTMKFEIIDNTTGKKYLPPEGKRWTYGKDSIDKFNAEGMLVFKDDKVYVKEYEKEENTKLFKNLLLEHGSLKSAKDELQKLGFPREGFPTPKPEILIQEILKMFTNEGDLVLDSFLGSGTTAAVAMKMNRRWIGIELGEHCYTYCKMRLDKVIDGEQGGISKDNNWSGGSGYKFYELAPTLINEDKFGEPVINSKYSPEMLASAVALHEGFEYSPSNTEFWKQSIGSENSYLYVTTKFINESALDEIVKSMKNNEYLIIACSAYDKQIEKKYKNIKIKKIPEMLLTKCQFGVDNYDLNIINPPEYDEEDE